MAKQTYQASAIRTMIAVGVFSALAYVACVFFHFKAGFLSFDLKDAVMAVGAMLFGPVYGLAMSLIVSLIEMVTISSTGLYGFVMNVLSSVTFVCVGSLIYCRFRTMRGAVIGMAASCVSMTAVMMAANLVVTPFYMGVSRGDVAAMIPTLLLPFNLTKAVFNASIVFLLYKPVTHALRAAGFVAVTSEKGSDGPTAVLERPASGTKKIHPAAVIAVLIGVAALLYFFVGLRGSFSFR